jgi:hypothetical protein
MAAKEDKPGDEEQVFARSAPQCARDADRRDQQLRGKREQG